ncbi:carbonic anhydrase 2-like [Drosophila takahashii]|uniref:carbonic anhydrase 2-like n=1 Tax=Drosophila takahashii TaxID=29030 RepID=UPI001CF929A7|nr:carbonic anhydrase 2-like [Drosophila takahashii]
MQFSTLSLIVCCSVALSWASEWGYPYLFDHQGKPFPKWGGLCARGKRQSPIDLHANGATLDEYAPLKFKNYDELQEKLLMVNNGHSVQISGFNQKLTLSGGALLNDYEVALIHMHWSSEHTINSNRYPLEVHIVHRNTIYPNMTMAENSEDGLVVIGVLFHTSNKPNEALGSIINSLRTVKSWDLVDKPVFMADSLTVGDWIPSVKRYFTYAGSLTTPNCNEIVTWIVFTETLPVTLDQVNEFKKIEFAKGKQLQNNSRELQSDNHRAVFLVEQREERSITAELTASVSLIMLITVCQKFLL